MQGCGPRTPWRARQGEQPGTAGRDDLDAVKGWFIKQDFWAGPNDLIYRAKRCHYRDDGDTAGIWAELETNPTLDASLPFRIDGSCCNGRYPETLCSPSAVQLDRKGRQLVGWGHDLSPSFRVSLVCVGGALWRVVS